MEKGSKWDISSRLFGVIVVFVVGLLTFWGFRVYEIWNSANGNYPREISVEGEGKAYVKPNIAKITMGLHTEGKTSEAVFAENTKKMNEVMKVLKENGIAESDLQTVSYYMNPNYVWSEEKGNTQDGFVLDQSVAVKVRDFTKIGDLMSKCAKAGANTVGGIEFIAEDIESAKAEARKMAIEKVKNNTVLISETSGLKFGKVLSYYEYMDNSGMYYEGKGGAVMSATPVSTSPTIAPGQQEIVLKVNLTYRVK